MNIFLTLITVILSVLMLLVTFIKLVFTDNHFQWLLVNSQQKIRFRNNVLSFLYFVKDIGPNVSSFAIIAMVVTSKETLIQLLVVFILGFILKEAARKTTAKFMAKVGKDNSWKGQ